jgi:hypothetical protein
MQEVSEVSCVQGLRLQSVSARCFRLHSAATGGPSPETESDNQQLLTKTTRVGEEDLALLLSRRSHDGYGGLLL